MKRVLILLFFVLFISGCGPDLGDENVFAVEDDGSDNGTNYSIENETVNNSTAEENESSNETGGDGHGPQTCLDTDNGKNYELWGMTVIENGKYTQVSDYCDNDYELVEYFCEGVNLGIEEYNCVGLGLYNCTAGACIEMNVTTNSTNTSNST